MPKTIRWGIWGAGAIAEKVAADFRLAPGNALHAVAARSMEKAKAFAARHKSAKAYCGLAALLQDEEVDAVYIATPNHLHVEDCIACIEAGKAVLCEKPFALNLAQTQRIVDAARLHQVFCMEAMWTRFIPAVVEAKRLIDAGELGTLKLAQGNFAHPAPASGQGRLFDPAMGGGVLLDLGVYLVSIAQYLLGEPQSVHGVAIMTASGVDEQSSYQLGYASGAIADLSASLSVRGTNEFFIAGERGSLRLCDPFYAAHNFELTRYTRPAAPAGAGRTAQGGLLSSIKTLAAAQMLRRRFGKVVSLLRAGRTKSLSFAGNGYQFELMEVARCLREGRMESAVMPLDDSLSTMRTMDALRAQWGLVYPGE